MAQGPVVNAGGDQVREGAWRIVLMRRIAAHIGMENAYGERVAVILAEPESQVFDHSRLGVTNPRDDRRHLAADGDWI
jgi:hypothetical protein